MLSTSAPNAFAVSDTMNYGASESHHFFQRQETSDRVHVRLESFRVGKRVFRYVKLSSNIVFRCILTINARTACDTLRKCSLTATHLSSLHPKDDMVW